MAEVLPLAKAVLKRSTQVAGLVLRIRDEAVVGKRTLEMLRRIQARGTIKQRDLLRSFHRHGQDQHARALDRLFEAGKVSRRTQGRSILLSYHEN